MACQFLIGWAGCRIRNSLKTRGSRWKTKWGLRFSSWNSNKRSSMYGKISAWSLSKKFWIIERLGRIISPRQKSWQRSRQPNRRYFELEINVKNGIFLIYSVVLQEPFQIDAMGLLSDWLTSGRQFLNPSKKTCNEQSAIGWSWYRVRRRSWTNRKRTSNNSWPLPSSKQQTFIKCKGCYRKNKREEKNLWRTTKGISFWSTEQTFGKSTCW